MENIQTKQYPCFKRWSRKNWSVFASLHRYVTIGVLSVGMSILLLATQGASAQTVDTTAVLKTLRIREVGVTGSQTAPARNAQSHTPLFDRKAQAPAPVQTLEAALRLAPSVDVRERGGKGTQADIFIRGGSFDQTMVLLNGIDFTDARTGHQSHALPVDLDCISAVELIDGVPGVGAYAGAVNIRTAPLRPTYLRLEASGGQYSYGYGNLSGAVSAGRFSVLGAASYRRSDGYRHNTDFTNDLFHMADLGFTELSMEPVVCAPEDPAALTAEDLEIVKDQYELLAKDMLRREKEGKPITFYHYMLDLTGGPCIYKRISGCGSGTEYMAVTPWGDLYPCHQFVGEEAYKLGDIWNGVTNTALREEFRSCNAYARPECNDCWARFYCSGGCAANAFHATGSIRGVYEAGCELFRKRIECAIMMKVAEDSAKANG